MYEDDAGGASDDEGDHLAAGKGKKYEKYDRESQKNYNYSMPEEFDDEEIDSDDVSGLAAGPSPSSLLGTRGAMLYTLATSRR